jgi:hypothetical protein
MIHKSVYMNSKNEYFRKLFILLHRNLFLSKSMNNNTLVVNIRIAIILFNY